MASSPREVDFTPSNFTASAIRYEIPALLSNSSVKVLRLPTDRLDEACTKCIVMMLEHDHVGPCLEELHLPNASIENSDQRCKHRDALVQIVLSLKQNTSINKLAISDITLNPNEISAIASILYDIKALRSLVLRQCGVDYRATSKISCALASNKSVESFDFSNNHIGNRGASALACALDINTTIKKLKLSGTHLGLEGAVAIASLLTSNSALEVLDLSRNQIGDMGASKIAIALKSNRSLLQLGLRQNNLSDVGALCMLLCLYDKKSIHTVLQCNHSIRYLNLSNNEVSRKCLMDVETACRMNHRVSKKQAIRKKVGFFFSDERNTSCFGDDMTIKCMPHLLSAVGSTESLTPLYNILTRVNMPAIFEQKPICTNSKASTDSIFSNENDTTKEEEKTTIPAFVRVEACKPISPL
eukprot:CAMPEP_0183767512 /NCGR_PEP_ID=MMETSP0739-20130205/12228_1 /TAXON_ID=385413 /ORGANISM="Thalassiosira miniscula, Strain CCMP1093" /LENGTH=414 /DNA_ID=CAMNT_0026006421 /DNA_START=132 /DNA_END=1376 /DNA_ORIENTATION=-